MRKKSSRQWLKEHFSDPYVKQAQLRGYRSRAAYKLIELQEKDRLFKPGMLVVDLGSAPGGWSQVITQYIQPQGHVIALDLLEMNALPGVDFIQGDFTDETVLVLIGEKLSAYGKDSVDWVVSDMAPNLSGNASIDLPRAMYLAELALAFARKILRDDGGFLVKMFQGEGFDTFLKELKQTFKQVIIRKPKASRGRSRELYILARMKKA